jgi:hypothetical protein
MGYEEVVPSPNKVFLICTAKPTYREDKSAKRKPSGFETCKKDGERLTQNSVFKMGVKILLPLLTLENNKVSLKKQVTNYKGELTKSSRALYIKHKDKMEYFFKCFAFYTAATNPKNRSTTLQHAISAMGEAKSKIMTDDPRRVFPFQDATGTVYQEYKRIPYPLRKHLEDYLWRKNSPEVFKKSESKDEDNKKRPAKSTGTLKAGENKLEIPVPRVPKKGKGAEYQLPESETTTQPSSHAAIAFGASLNAGRGRGRGGSGGRGLYSGSDPQIGVSTLGPKPDDMVDDAPTGVSSDNNQLEGSSMIL